MPCSVSVTRLTQATWKCAAIVQFGCSCAGFQSRTWKSPNTLRSLWAGLHLSSLTWSVVGFVHFWAAVGGLP